MRDIFQDLQVGQPTDPTEAARSNMRARLRRRFYEQASVAEADDGFLVLLDGRTVRTPARHALSTPWRPLSEAIAAEWQAQAELIDPVRMPLTRLANSIIDGVVSSPDAVRAEIAQYLGSDLVFYRADAPEALARRQAHHWDPILAWAREELGARFVLATGLVHVSQPEHALEAAAAAIPQDPWRLGAVHSIATLTGSALTALAVAHRRLSAEAAWAAAHVDEDWNMERWGRDELALERRSFRRAEMEAAASVLALTPT
jgi:chaperone required for assembly of F1-ATPase